MFFKALAKCCVNSISGGVLSRILINLLKNYGSIPTKERYVQEGKIITAQGVSAGIDMSLFLASQIAGDENAKAYQLFIEYDPKPPFISGNIEWDKNLKCF